MPKSSDNENKHGNLDAKAYLYDNGFSRPTDIERKKIVEIYSNIGKKIKKGGFDVIKTDDREKLEKGERITLYKITSCDESRGLKISEGFKGHGITVNSAVKSNADDLGEQFKYLLVNMATKKILEIKLSDFFNNEVSSISEIKHWVIHIKKDLKT